jgi:hypothetical protein
MFVVGIVVVDAVAAANVAVVLFLMRSLLP